MPNSIFNALNSGNNGGMPNFVRFMRQMRGQDPKAIINDMVQSGRISQEQLNAVQQQADAVKSKFEGFRSMFGF